MENLLKKCEMCPRKCKVNRYLAKGYCKGNEKVKVAHIALHKYEEPCISNKNGSGTVFFSGCNLSCVFCQNYNISTNEYGKELTVSELSEEFLKLQKMGADNINLVSPTIYIYQIIEAIKLSKKRGLNIPIIYNTNGYENIDSLKKLEGYIDIFLPDFKYSTSFLAEKYSNAKNYPQIVVECIKECLRQQSVNIYDENGKLLKGVIIRHLILPNYILNTKNVLKILKENFGNNITISLMSQYFPTYKAEKIEKLNRKINKKEYMQALNYLQEFGFENGYLQEKNEEDELTYVPNFDISTI